MNREQVHVLPDARSRGERRHLPALDGVRGIAILLVLVFHQCQVGQAHNRLDRIVLELANTGWTGVTLFFVLSGFLITGILLDSKGAAHYFRNFYARRALRIFPLYYAVLFFTLIVLARIVLPRMGIDPDNSALAKLSDHEWWYWVYLANWRIAHYGPSGTYLDVSWSLSIEEQFYLIWPLLVWMMRPRMLWPFCCVMIVGAIALRFWMLGIGLPPGAVKVLTTSFFDALGAGAFLAVMARSPGVMAKFAAAAPWVLVAAVAAFLVCWFRAPNEFDQFYPNLTMPLAVLASAALIVLAYHRGSAAKWLAWGPLRFFGRFSYAMYLLHLPVQILTRAFFDPNDYRVFGSVLPAQVGFCAICTLWVSMCALISWYLLEQPCLSLKRFFRDQPVKSVAA